MTKLFRMLLTGSLLCCTAAHADVVADWNAIALNAVESSGAQPAAALRALAGVHVAMFEAMNFIERGYVPRLVVRPASPIAASSEAAAAVAAHLVLSRLYPERSAAFDSALERSLAEIPDDVRKTSGTVTGRAIGGNVYAVWTWDEATVRTPRAPDEAASDPLLWNLIAAKLIEGRRLAPIDAARVHALVSTAVSDLYSAAGRGSRAFRAERSCVPCAAGVATLRVLESALAQQRPRQAGLDEAVILRALLAYGERSAEASDRRLGEGFGSHALSHYRPVS